MQLIYRETVETLDYYSIWMNPEPEKVRFEVHSYENNTDSLCSANLKNLFLTVQCTSLEKIRVFLPKTQVISAASNDDSGSVGFLPITVDQK